MMSALHVGHFLFRHDTTFQKISIALRIEVILIRRFKIF